VGRAWRRARRRARARAGGGARRRAAAAVRPRASATRLRSFAERAAALHAWEASSEVPPPPLRDPNPDFTADSVRAKTAGALGDERAALARGGSGSSGTSGGAAPSGSPPLRALDDVNRSSRPVGLWQPRGAAAPPAAPAPSAGGGAPSAARARTTEERRTLIKVARALGALLPRAAALADVPPGYSFAAWAALGRRGELHGRFFERVLGEAPPVPRPAPASPEAYLAGLLSWAAGRAGRPRAVTAAEAARCVPGSPARRYAADAAALAALGLHPAAWPLPLTAAGVRVAKREAARRAAAGEDEGEEADEEAVEEEGEEEEEEDGEEEEAEEGGAAAAHLARVARVRDLALVLAAVFPKAVGAVEGLPRGRRFASWPALAEPFEKHVHDEFFARALGEAPLPRKPEPGAWEAHLAELLTWARGGRAVTRAEAARCAARARARGAARRRGRVCGRPARAARARAAPVALGGAAHARGRAARRGRRREAARLQLRGRGRGGRGGGGGGLGRRELGRRRGR
jgi:hypothetical protein